MIFLFWGHIFIDLTSTSRVAIEIILLDIWTRGGMIYGKRSASEASITGGKSITSTLEFSLIYTTTEIAVTSATETTITSWLILILGDDFFSNYQIQLSPTLTLTASTGISLNAGNNGPPVANNTT
jgi:hypothetical protein